MPIDNLLTKTIEWGHELGFYRMVVDADTDKILGATLVGYETAELVHVFLSLMEAEATWQLLERFSTGEALPTVHIHPTYGEALPSLARLLLGESSINVSSQTMKLLSSFQISLTTVKSNDRIHENSPIDCLRELRVIAVAIVLIKNLSHFSAEFNQS